MEGCVNNVNDAELGVTEDKSRNCSLETKPTYVGEHSQGRKLSVSSHVNEIPQKQRIHSKDSGLPSSPCFSGSDSDVADILNSSDTSPGLCHRLMSDPTPCQLWPASLYGDTKDMCVNHDVFDADVSALSSSSDNISNDVDAFQSPRHHPVSRSMSSEPFSSQFSPPSKRSLMPTISFSFGENNPPPAVPCSRKHQSFPFETTVTAGDTPDERCSDKNIPCVQPADPNDLCSGGNMHFTSDTKNTQQCYSGLVNGHSSDHPDHVNTDTTSHSDDHKKTSEVACWGHFSKHSGKHYKYRRSDYSSDSEDDPPHAASMLQKSKVKSVCSQKSHLPQVLCKTASPNKLVKVDSVHVSDTEDVLDYREGVKPTVFKEKLITIMRWFTDFNDEQKNILLKSLLNGCDLPQIHLLSVKMEANLHRGCPPNCQDIVTWLPATLAAKIMDYLDPVSLCRASQVCKMWQLLAGDPSLWRRFCCQQKWRLSKAAEHKQVISHMSLEGSIQWKNVFAERFRLRNNWLRGRCTVRTFEGHTQGISCVQFDDTRIVSGSSDKTIKVWNIRTNAPWSVQTLVGHSNTVRCLHLEGNRLVSGSSDRTIKVWDLSTQDSWSSIACKVTMIGHTHTVRCLKVDDDKVISGSYDKTLKLWDLRTGNCRMTLRGHQAAVLCVHFNETKIVSGSCDNTIKVWNYEGVCIRTLTGHQDAVTCLQFDSTRIVSGSLDCNLKFWDIHTGECVNTIDWKAAEGHTGVVRCLQADGWRLVSAADDKTIKVWNLETCQRLVTLQNHKDGVTCLQFNDFIIVSGSYDKTVKLWDFSCC
ncbi:F-box/WD repeat-containing protein 11-like [Gigantopelta aegis]|uniref:F-box/WD repeat-containing protein 11-like n=1 Tax=Gigantopelta aegis TaxID=1735272 RepID=UPI001B88DBCC|nr:F-box/WD repeat-containing protein 11-like [Gigantopelta aegis]